MTRQPIFKTIAEGKAPYDNDRYNTDPANKQRGNYAVPVAVLPEAAAKLLETDAGLVKLSVADGAKQAANHADLTAADYRRIQQALDTAQAYWLSDPVQRQVHIFADLADFSVRLILRKAKSTGEVFLKSFSFINRGEAEAKSKSKSQALTKQNFVNSFVER